MSARRSVEPAARVFSALIYAAQFELSPVSEQIENKRAKYMVDSPEENVGSGLQIAFIPVHGWFVPHSSAWHIITH